MSITTRLRQNAAQLLVNTAQRISKPQNEQARSRDELQEMGYAAGYTPVDVQLLGNEMIYSAVALVATTLASMPLHLYKGDQIARDHPLERLVAYDPSPRMHAFEWRRTMQANVSNVGRAYSVIRRADNGITPLRFQLADPARVVDVIIPKTDEVWHRVTWEDGEVEWIHKSNMFSLRGLSANGVHGISQHSVLQGAISYDRRVKAYSAKMMDDINSTIAITVPNTGMSKERQEAIVDEFWKIYKGSGGKAVVLQGGMTASQLSKSPFDTKAAEVEKATKNRIATVNQVPPHMLGDYSDTNYSTADQTMLEFQQVTLLGWVSQWETELNRQLLTWDMIRAGYGWRFSMDELQRGDTLSMANKHSIAIRSAKMTPNEARAEDGLPAVEGGNELFISRDLIPLTVALEQAKAAAAATTTAKKGVRKNAAR